MKLRLYRDSIRLRLSPSEVANLRQGRFVEEITHFSGKSQFAYRLEIDPKAKQIHADFDAEKLVVRLPKSLAEHWAATNETAMSHQQELPDGAVLKILVEKDFECLNAEENEAGVVLFPNPRNAKC